MSLAVSGKRAPQAARSGVLGLAAALLGIFFAIGTFVGPAQAHAELLGASPEDGSVLDAPPEVVELLFNEPVQLVEGAARLFPGDGTPVVLDARTVDTTVTVSLPAGLDDGAYTLAYRVVSADGHPVGGAITFQVGEGAFAAPDATPAPADAVVTEAAVSLLTFAQYLGLLVFAGLLFFDGAVLRTGRRPAPRTRRILRIALAVAVTASALLLPTSGARVHGSELVAYDPEHGDLVVLPLAVWLPGVSWQLAASALLVAVLGVTALAVASRSATWRARAAVACCTAGALATPLLVGHTQTVRPVAAMLAADLVHLVAGAFWVGGVIGLLSYLRAARPVASGDRPRVAVEDAAAVVATFSRYALVSVLLLAASGILMGVLIVGSWQALLVSTYGRLLLAKLGLVAVVVALAACNRLRFLPRISRIPGAAEQWLSLRRTLRWEAAVLVAVLAVTGFLTNTSPGSESGSGSGSGSESGSESGSGAAAPASAPLVAQSQGLTVDGSLAPATPGTNELAFKLRFDGEPVTTEDVVVEARLPEQELGPLTATAQFDPETGDYAASLPLPLAGEWQIRVLARIDTYTQPIAVTVVTIP